MSNENLGPKEMPDIISGHISFIPASRTIEGSTSTTTVSYSTPPSHIAPSALPSGLITSAPAAPTITGPYTAEHTGLNVRRTDVWSSGISWLPYE